MHHLDCLEVQLQTAILVHLGIAKKSCILNLANFPNFFYLLRFPNIQQNNCIEAFDHYGIYPYRYDDLIRGRAYNYKVPQGGFVRYTNANHLYKCPTPYRSRLCAQKDSIL